MTPLLRASDWNPRWLAFARSRSLEPTSPNLKTWDFMAWTVRQWSEWERATGRRASAGRSEQDHADFDAWLDVRFP